MRCQIRKVYQYIVADNLTADGDIGVSVDRMYDTKLY